MALHDQYCETVLGWTTVELPSHSDPDLTYTLVIQDPTNAEEVICECEGYIHRGQCSHQTDALELLCGWTQEKHPIIAQTAKQHRDHICPRCLGPTVNAEV